MSKEPSCGVYILTNNDLNVFYVGTSTNLAARIWVHQQKIVMGFTRKYNVTRLVYIEPMPDRQTALHREKQIKKYSRFKKIQLILSLNPTWDDLSPLL